MNVTSIEDSNASYVLGGSCLGSPEIHYDIVITLSVASFFGLIGNTTFIIIGMVHRGLRHSKPNKLLLQLAFAGLVYIIVKVPTAIDLDANGGCFRYGLIGCKMFAFLITLSRSLTIWTLVASAIHLCFDITRKSFQTADPSKTIVFVWVWCLIISVPSLFLARMYFDDYHCTTVPIELDLTTGGIKDKTPYFVCHITWALLLYIIPLCFICGAYGFVSYKLVSSFRMLRDDQPQMKSMIEERKRVVYVFVGVTTLFAMSWLPYYTFRLSLLSNDPETTRIANKLSKPSLMSTVLFTCIYPWFIYVVSVPYRKGFITIFGCKKLSSGYNAPTANTTCHVSQTNVPNEASANGGSNNMNTVTVAKAQLNSKTKTTSATSPV